MSRRRNYAPLFVVVLLVVAHFALVPWLGSARIAPDFLLLALLVYSIRARPGAAAVAGFLMGLLGDALISAPADITVFGVPGVAFGSATLAHTIVGYLAAWGKAVFFAENLVVNAGFILAGVWLRDALLLTAGGFVTGGSLFWQLAFWSVLKGLTTAVAGVTILLAFRRWLNIRLDD